MEGIRSNCLLKPEVCHHESAAYRFSHESFVGEMQLHCRYMHHRVDDGIFCEATMTKDKKNKARRSPRDVSEVARSRVVVVLAMHRSGSSVMARGLKALDVDLGNDLLEASEGENDKGFWEDIDIFNLNERLLSKAQSSWQKLAPLDGTQFEGPAYATERREAAELLVKKLRPGVVFGFKDPRTVVLFAFWRCVFEDLELDVRYLITVRNPLETAASLNKRSGFPMHKGTVLWAKHMIEAVRETSGEPRVFVAYDQILRDPEGELTRMASALGLEQPDKGALAEFRDEFLEDGLRHNFIGKSELARSGLASPFVIDLYETVTRFAQQSVEDVQELDADAWQSIEAGYAQLSPILIYSDFIDQKRAESIGQIEALDRRVRETTEELQQVKADYQVTENARADAEGTLQQKLKELDELRTSNSAEIGILTESKEAAEARIRELQKEVDERATSKSAALARVEELEGELSQMSRALERAKSESQNAEKALGEADKRLNKTLEELDESQKLSAEKIDSLNEANEAAEEQVRALHMAAQRDRAEFDAKLGAAFRQLDESRLLNTEKIESLTSANEAAEAQIAKLHAEADVRRVSEASAIARAQGLQEKLNRMNDAVVQAKSAQAMTERKRSELHKELEALQAVHDELRDQNAAEMDDLRQEKERSQEATERLDQDRRALRKELLLLKAEMNVRSRSKTWRLTSSIRATYHAFWERIGSLFGAR